jgi:hypothetical protein
MVRSAMLYLHEIIDIVGTGQESYLQTVGERGRHSEREGISRLMGTWKVIGSTNRWPRVVNLWEMDGWGQWAETLERQFLPGKVDAALAPWWANGDRMAQRAASIAFSSPRPGRRRAINCAPRVCARGCVSTRSRARSPASVRPISPRSPRA